MNAKLIVADPPWMEKGSGATKRGADRHYDLMTPTEIVETMLSAKFEDGSPAWCPEINGCQVWLWVTANRLLYGLKVLEALNVRYITNRAWVKCRPMSEASISALNARVEEVEDGQTAASIVADLNPSAFVLQRFGLGQYLRGAHETALLGTIGSRPSQCKTIPSVLLARRGEHSAKPDRFYQDAMQIAGAGAGECIEFFGRGPREGWRVWGDQSSGTARITVQSIREKAKAARLTVQNIEGLSRCSAHELREIDEALDRRIAARTVKQNSTVQPVPYDCPECHGDRNLACIVCHGESR